MTKRKNSIKPKRRIAKLRAGPEPAVATFVPGDPAGTVAVNGRTVAHLTDVEIERRLREHYGRDAHAPVLRPDHIVEPEPPMSDAEISLLLEGKLRDWRWIFFYCALVVFGICTWWAVKAYRALPP